MAYKKKLYKFRPKDNSQKIETHFSKEQKKAVSVNSMAVERDVRQISTMHFKPMWAGYAVAEATYQLSAGHKAIRQIVQRTGETQDSYAYKAFVTTSKMPAADLMTLVFPQRM